MAVKNADKSFSSLTFKEQAKLVLDWIIILSPVILAAISGYLLFLVIIPFFMLGLHQVPHQEIVTGKLHYIDHMGIFAWFGVAITLNLAMLTVVWWIFSAINLARTRRWYIGVLLALAPLPIVFYYSGPYEFHAWTGP